MGVIRRGWQALQDSNESREGEKSDPFSWIDSDRLPRSVFARGEKGREQVCRVYSERRREYILKGLILAQNERWRRGLGMQVERIPRGLLLGGSGERGSKAWVTYPGDVDSLPNGWVIPNAVHGGHPLSTKVPTLRERSMWY